VILATPPRDLRAVHDEARFGAWLEVEVLAVEAWARLAWCPKPTPEPCASAPVST